MTAAFDIVDEDGAWFQSKALFPLIDPNSHHYFVPGQTVKIRPNAWIAMQVEARAFIAAADPMKVEASPPAAAPPKPAVTPKEKASKA